MTKLGPLPLLLSLPGVLHFLLTDSSLFFRIALSFANISFKPRVIINYGSSGYCNFLPLSSFTLFVLYFLDTLLAVAVNDLDFTDVFADFCVSGTEMARGSWTVGSTCIDTDEVEADTLFLLPLTSSARLLARCYCCAEDMIRKDL